MPSIDMMEVIDYFCFYVVINEQNDIYMTYYKIIYLLVYIINQ